VATTKKQAGRRETGKLRIGDQWNAIALIAQSQPHALKAVCELVENAIDAGAKQVQIFRRRRKGRLYVEVHDEGQGVPLNDDGQPDFARIATHICDSMKRGLNEQQRSGIHGEFGIGLLSFWSLGEELRMTSAGRAGTLQEMTLRRGKRDYNVRPVRGELVTGGTRVVVGPLLEATRKIVTGDKLQRYLSEELRDRIRNAGVQVCIIDRVSRKELLVTPREFEGDQLDLPREIKTRCGPLFVELYLSVSGRKEKPSVAVCKDGTRVLGDLCELIQLQHAPWTEARLEGVLDFPALNLAPGTRSGLVPDDRLEEFLSAIHALETPLVEEIDRWDRAETDKASRQILRQVHRAFVSALRELPPHEYFFFDIPQAGRQRGRAEVFVASGGGEEGLPLGAAQAEIMTGPESDRSPTLFLPEPGPLAAVTVRPRSPRRRPGEECPLTAAAFDAEGERILSDVTYRWQITDGGGKLTAIRDERCVATSDQTGGLVVAVEATQGNNSATAEVVVKFLDDVTDNDETKGLPSYRLEAEHGNPARSRYEAKKNEIVINSAHRDFLSSKTTGAKHRRYIGKIYAKEVVLINFPHESSNDVMEHLIEVLVRTEDAL
jgi:hypothetical protein